jgi:hypothetical protein
MKDNAFAELKDTEILNNRIQALIQMEPYIGKFYSVNWVKKNVLRMSEDQIQAEEAQIKKEGDYQLSNAQIQGQMAGIQQVATNDELNKAGYMDQETGEGK